MYHVLLCVLFTLLAVIIMHHETDMFVCLSLQLMYYVFQCVLFMLLAVIIMRLTCVCVCRCS